MVVAVSWGRAGDEARPSSMQPFTGESRLHTVDRHISAPLHRVGGNRPVAQCGVCVIQPGECPLYERRDSGLAAEAVGGVRLG